jgi:hypothetical protein
VGAQSIDFFPQVGDAAADIPPVDLQLGLAWAPQAHTADPPGSPGPAARLPRQVRPGTRQPRQSILVLRQLDLQGPLPAVRVLRKDVKDQRRSIEQSQLVAEGALEFTLMSRRELVVEDHDIGQQLAGQIARGIDFRFA